MLANRHHDLVAHHTQGCHRCDDAAGVVTSHPYLDNGHVDDSAFKSDLHKSSHRSSGLSWWGERPGWIRHGTYWVLALGLLLASLVDDDPGTISDAGDDDVAWFVWFVVVVLVICVASLVFTLKEWQQVGAARTISRSFVLFTFFLGFATGCLVAARQWGVDIAACHLVSAQEICAGQASPRQVVGMLAWHAADVVPVLKATHSFEWERPARSDSIVVGASVVLVRLWVAIGVLGVIKLIWDSWGLTTRSRARPAGEHARP